MHQKRGMRRRRWTEKHRCIRSCTGVQGHTTVPVSAEPLSLLMVNQCTRTSKHSPHPPPLPAAFPCCPLNLIVCSWCSNVPVHTRRMLLPYCTNVRLSVQLPAVSSLSPDPIQIDGAQVELNRIVIGLCWRRGWEGEGSLSWCTMRKQSGNERVAKPEKRRRRVVYG